MLPTHVDLVVFASWWIAFSSGRKKVVSEFRALVSSFPEAMGSMQSQLHKCKEAATNAHSVRADMLSLSSIIDRMVGRVWLCYTCKKLNACHNFFWLDAGERVWKFVISVQGPNCRDTEVASYGTINLSDEIFLFLSVLFKNRYLIEK